VTTLAFAVAAESWIPRQHWLIRVSGGETSLQLPRPRWFGVSFASELHYYWLCLAVLIVTAAAVAHVRRTGLGRAWLAVRDNEAAAAASSISPRRTKLVAFAVAGVIASLAGYLYGGLLVNFTQVPLFRPADSLALL